MAAPPVSKESNKISMVVGEWEDAQSMQFSATHRINEYPWRLCLSRDMTLKLICDKSEEANLWKCAATIKTSLRPRQLSTATYQLASWASKRIKIWKEDWPVGTKLEVEVTTEEDGESWRRRPILNSLVDGTLVFGEEKKKIEVNKESLASQSPFFDRLFFGDFKEKNMGEIPIGDVEYEVFSNIVKMIYNFHGVALSAENVGRVLQLADRFELKIVEDRVVSFVLSQSCSFSQTEKLFFAEEYDIPFLREVLISQYTRLQLEELSDSREWERLSPETTRALLKKCCKLH